MSTIQFSSLADDVRNLPSQGPGRDRQLHRLIDLHAAAEAAAALRTAARARSDAGTLASVLASAGVVLAIAERGPLMDDATARDRLRDAASSAEFLGLVPALVRELRETAANRPDSGACTIASALELWSWTMKHFVAGDGARIPSSSIAVDELSEVLCPLFAARSLALETLTSRDTIDLHQDFSRIYAARAASTVGGLCAELVFGYRPHMVWDAEGCAACYSTEQLDDLEALMPGIGSGAGMTLDVVETDGSHPVKAGPCASFEGLDSFMRLRRKLDGCLTGSRLAKSRAVAAIARSLDAKTPAEARG